MITLYHGSYTQVAKPLAKIGRKNLDFGQGFYLTSIREQAEKWAVVIAQRKGRQVLPTLNIYSFNDELAKLEGVRFKVFPIYNLEWLEFVVDCRRGLDVSNDYDIIEGGVANDKVIDTVEDYEKGVITAEQALGQLIYKKTNHQMCIINQFVIDKYLTFIESRTI